jgi:hypothetical protein
MSIAKGASTVRREIRSVNMVCTSLTAELVLHTRTRCSRDVHYDGHSALFSGMG